MQDYLGPYRTALSFNEYLIKAAVAYWTAVSYPTLYFAKHL